MSFKANIYTQLGASNHSDKTRDEHDYYATEPRAVEMLLEALERDSVKIPNLWWECANGGGHITNVLRNNGYKVVTSDLINRGGY